MRLVAALLAAVVLSGCTPPGPKALLDGERLLKQGKPVDAIRRFRTAVEFLPGNAQAWNHLGLAYHLARQPAEAAEAYQQAARLDRNLAAVFYNLGCLRLETDDPARAGEALRTHVGLDPKSVDGWRKLGQSQLRLQQWDQAERSYLTALKLIPQDPESLNGLGVTYQQRRRARDAWQCFSQVTTRHPNFAPAWYNLGIAAHQAGARSQAILAFNRYRQLAPTSSAGLGLDALLRQWSAAEAAANQPALPSPAPAAQEPNKFLPTPRPNTNRVVVPAPVPAPTATTPTNQVPTPTPAQNRPPARRANVESPSAPTNSDLAAKSIPQAVASNPVTPPAAKPGPLLASATSPPATSIVARAAPPPPTPTVTPTNPPLEIVELAPSATVATQVLDEPTPTGTTAATTGTTAALPGPTSAPPVIRPVAARRPEIESDTANRRGFWDRANPVRWFSSEKEVPNTDPSATTTAPDSERDSDRWRWAKPGSWFKSDSTKSSASTSTRPTTNAARASIPPTGVANDTVAPANPSNADTGPRQVADARPRSSSAVPSRPVAPVPPKELKRYRYTHPAAPEPGDRAAARPLLDEATQEHRRGRLDNAENLYQQVVQLDPASADAHQFLSAIQLQKGEVSRALTSAELALALRPESAPARLNFALALEQGDFPVDAVAEAERIVEKNPADAQARLLLGNLYAQRLGDTDRARKHYAKLIELEPEHPQSIPIRRWLAAHPATDAR
ncbi:MAG: tetratricopeptide repeat protein [Verrucomicrobiales bacterium]|nr:tetratricopeptide repeat protein [Verrucomicrobiales bacterium]